MSFCLMFRTKNVQFLFLHEQLLVFQLCLVFHLFFFFVLKFCSSISIQLHLLFYLRDLLV